MNVFKVIIGFVGALLFLTACGGGDTVPPPTADVEPPTATHTPIFDVQIMPTVTPGATATIFIAQRATLPPSWTPTRTPTVTLTPTITQTPLPTATLTEQEICDDDFAASFAVVEDRLYTLDDRIYITMYSRNRDAILLFRAENRATGTEETFTLRGGTALIDLLPLRFLGEAGVYDWSITLNLPDRSELCEVTGTLNVRNDNTLLDLMRSQAPEETAEPLPEATEDPTDS